MSRLCRLRNKSHGDDGQWAYEEITKLREQVEAQAAVIEKLREIIPKLIDATPGHAGQCSGLKCRERYCYSCNDEEDADAYLQTVWDLCHDANKALSIPTDSTQILDEVRRAERERQLAGIPLDDIKQALTKYSEMLVHVDCSPVYRKHLAEIRDKAQVAIRAME